MNRLLSVSLAGALGLAACAKQPAAPSAKPASQPAASAETEGDGRLPADTVVATWKGGKLTYGELLEKNASAFKQLRRKYVQDLYSREQQAVEMQVVEQLVEAAAKKEGMSADDYMKKMVGDPEVTEAEAKDFYDKNLATRGQPYEAMKDRIIGFLKGQKAQTSVAAVLTRLKEEAGVKIDLPEPAELKVNLQLAGRPMKGNKDAKITIVEFSDFQCPYCSRAAPEVDKIVEAMPNDVRVYFLHFPLSFHERAKPSAIAAECAHQQGKFWELHDKLFGNQQKLDDATIQGYAKELGLDAAKFDACLKSPETEKIVKADMDQGNTAGVTGTPFFLVNGKPHRGPPSVAELKALLNPQAAAKAPKVVHSAEKTAAAEGAAGAAGAAKSAPAK